MGDDRELLDAFESATLPLLSWNHRAHLQVAWLYLRDRGLGEATECMRRGVQRFNDAKGIESRLDAGYHDTLTVAWMRILASARARQPELGFDELLQQNPHLGCRTLLRLLYSREHLLTWEAKREFVDGDLAPLPRV